MSPEGQIDPEDEEFLAAFHAQEFIWPTYRHLAFKKADGTHATLCGYVKGPHTALPIGNLEGYICPICEMVQNGTLILPPR